MFNEVTRRKILSTSFVIWCALLSFPLIGIEREGPGTFAFIFQAFGLMQLAAVTFTFYPSTTLKIVIRYDGMQSFILLLLVCSFALQLHGEGADIATGIFYTLALLITIMMLSMVFALPLPERTSCFRAAAVVFAGFGATAITVLGWPENRYIGNIHPNFVGTIALAAFVLAQFSSGALSWLLKVAGLGLAAIVSARFAVIGCVAALVVFELTYNPISSRSLVLAVAAALGAAFFGEFVIDVMALDDPTRNVSSGFSGRDEEWRFALEQIVSTPFGIGFKRQYILESGHNGYLKAIIEFGIAGGALIIAAVLSIVVRSLFDAVLHAGRTDAFRRHICARAAGLVALAFATFFQPQMFNLGDMHGILFLLLLFAPPFSLSLTRSLVGAGSSFRHRTLDLTYAGRR